MPSNPIEEACELGRELSAIYTSEELLPEDAYRLLGNSGIHDGFDPDIFGRSLASFALPDQLKIPFDFAEPSITVYKDPLDRFVIEFFFWITSDTSIHDHAFNGAGKIVYGNSFEIAYDYSPEVKVADNLTFGKLRARSHRILSTGRTFKVIPGLNFIHEVWHLHEPSVTLMIRQPRRYRDYRSFAFVLPGMAFQEQFNLETFHPTRKLIDFYLLSRKLRLPVEKEYIRTALKSASIESLLPLYFAFLQSIPSLKELDVINEDLVERYGEWAMRLRDVGTRVIASTQMPASKAGSPDQKLFLCLLHSAGFGPEMEGVIKAWASEMAPRAWMKNVLFALEKNSSMNGKWCRFLSDLVENGGVQSLARISYRHGLQPWDHQMMSSFNLSRWEKLELPATGAVGSSSRFGPAPEAETATP